MRRLSQNKPALALFCAGAAHSTPSSSPTPEFRLVIPTGSGARDPYNAADFVGPEDFYEANWDAFDNLDDAEAYWNEHR